MFLHIYNRYLHIWCIMGSISGNVKSDVRNYSSTVGDETPCIIMMEMRDINDGTEDGEIDEDGGGEE